MNVLLAVDSEIENYMSGLFYSFSCNVAYLGTEDLSTYVEVAQTGLIVISSNRTESLIQSVYDHRSKSAVAQINDFPLVVLMGEPSSETKTLISQMHLAVALVFEPQFEARKSFFEFQLQSLVTRVSEEIKVKDSQGGATEGLFSSDLGSYLSHEINNPLGAASLRIAVIEEILSESQDVNLKQEVTNELKEISNIHQRISKITAALRRFAIQGENEPKTFLTVEALLEDVGILCEYRLKSKGVEFSVRTEILEEKIWCNPTEIVQTLVNLTMNAMHAVEALPSRWVSIEVSHADEGWVQIAVTDAGKGIAPEIAETIFEPYVSTKRKTGGTGLGLSFSRKVVEEHGGDISIDASAENTRFIFTLPTRPLAKDVA